MSGIEDSPAGSESARGTFTFGHFAFDAETLELRIDGEVRALEPLPARILGVLLARSGRLVCREDLREFGWPRLPGVADDSLNTCIAQIREALEDDARTPRWIETLRGRGYRFRGAAVRVVAEPLRPANRGVWRRPAAIGALAGAAALVIGGELTSHNARNGRAPLDPEAAAGVAGVRYRMTRALDLAGAMVLADSLVVQHREVPATHAVRATVLMFAGRRLEAWSEAGQALAMDPDQPEALRVIGNLHMFDASWSEARVALERSTEQDPEASETWVSLAYFQTIRGEFARAAEALERALALDPMSALILGDAGLLHLWAGRYDAAVEACATAVGVEPRAAWAISCAFDAARLAGRSDEAVAWGRRLPGMLTLPDDADVTDVLTARALGLENAAANGRGDPYALATTYAALGHVEQAEQALGLAALSPGFGVLAAAVDPRMAPMRGRTAYESLVTSLGLTGVESARSGA